MYSYFSLCVYVFVLTFLSTPDEICAPETTQNIVSQQIAMWLQGLFLFTVVWSLGVIITGNSCKKFDVFYRKLIMDMYDEHPRPKTIKFKKNNIFPKRGNENVSHNPERVSANGSGQRRFMSV